MVFVGAVTVLVVFVSVATVVEGYSLVRTGVSIVAVSEVVGPILSSFSGCILSPESISIISSHLTSSFLHTVQDFNLAVFFKSLFVFLVVISGTHVRIIARSITRMITLFDAQRLFARFSHKKAVISLKNCITQFINAYKQQGRRGKNPRITKTTKLLMRGTKPMV